MDLHGIFYIFKPSNQESLMSRTTENLKNHSVLILSVKNRIFKRLFAGETFSDNGFTAKALTSPLNPKKVIIVFHALQLEELMAAYRKIFHYGNYSYLYFKNGVKQEATATPMDQGMIVSLSVSMNAIETKKALDISEVIERIKDNTVVYVGEMHDQYAHHLVQLEIIRGLYQKDKKLMIGMEMFQRPFQVYLDQFIQGKISEAEMLKKTEYFNQWRFDYNLYRDILEYARSKQIPIIALNLKKEIINKVSRKGIDSLSSAEYSQIPQDIDMTNQFYHESLAKVYESHTNRESIKLENFIQSQILWDSTMAHRIAKALKDNPERQMVVLAGNGHLQYAWGIPNRVKRLSNLKGPILLNGLHNQLDESIADFIFFPELRPIPPSPKLGITLEEKDQVVTVTGVMPGSVAENANLKKGDIMTAIDSKNIETIADIKIFLLNKKPGDRIKLKIRRKKLGRRAKEKELEIAL